MSFFTGLAAVTAAAGIVTGIVGSGQQASALESQAAQIENLTEDEQAFIQEQSEIEAFLIEQQGIDEAEILAFNEDLALENAAWERQAGDVAFSQAQRRWEAQVKSVQANLAASGARLDTSTNALILEQLAEMEEDLFLLDLNAERAASQDEAQAGFFSLQRGQVERRTEVTSAARRRIGDIEAEVAGTSAAARAAAARTGATTARISGATTAISGASSLLSQNAASLDRLFR